MINNPWQSYQVPQAYSAPQAYQTQQAYPVPQAYQAQSYQPNAYRPTVPAPQTMEGPQYMQPGMINARYAACREEAVAAHVVPGDPYIFADFAHGRVYVKQINPQTMAADFAEFARVQPVQQPVEFPTQQQAFATQADLDGLRAELESLRTSITANKTSGKAVAANDE